MEVTKGRARWQCSFLFGSLDSARVAGTPHHAPPGLLSIDAIASNPIAMKFRVIIEQDEDVFLATVPTLPGCVSQGTTRDEAVVNVREAIEGYLESLRDHGDPIPPSIGEEIIDIAT